MRIYLDDDSASPLLAKLLRQAGHDVQLPSDAGFAGADDALHLTHAVKEDRVFLSSNHDHFRILHGLMMQGQGHHAGMLIVRRDNNPRRDLTPRGIVHAVATELLVVAVFLDVRIVSSHVATASPGEPAASADVDDPPQHVGRVKHTIVSTRRVAHALRVSN